MVRTEIVRSAGGVVCREEKGQLMVVLVATKGGERWGLPKGWLEKGEKAEEAACREVEEETGLLVTVLKELDTIDYWYYPDKSTRHHKFVDFFLMACQGGRVENHDWEVEEARWFPIEEALDKISYDSERKMLARAREEWLARDQ
ncbi:MAG: NUDIX hydrolase [Anaerolineae bacterium]